MENSSRSRTSNNGSLRSAAYRAATEETPDSIDIFRKFWREEGASPVDKRGDTLLHILAIYANEDALRLLFREGLVTNEDLKSKNVDGDTALHEAARFGQRGAAEIMLKEEKDLVRERNKLGETPIYAAAAHGEKKVFALLEKFSSDCMMRRNDGCTVLHAAVMGERYRLAISILESYPNLAGKLNDEGQTALCILAGKRNSFKSGSSYMFKHAGWRPFILMQIIRATAYRCIPVLYKESQPVKSAEDPLNNAVSIYKLKRSFFTKFILGKFRFKKIDEAKQRHTLALMLAERLIRREDWTVYIRTQNNDLEDSQLGISSPKENRVADPFIQAMRHGIDEIILEILRVHPEAADIYDEKGRNILQIVVEHKHRFLYDYLMNNLAHKRRMICEVDHEGNSIMHLAATLGSPPSFPPGVVQQMMWDILWFKRVKYDCYPYLWHMRNSDGMKPKQLFEENHLELRKEAERSIREINDNLMVVAALMATINFAAVFTLPGGFDQDTGLPMLLKGQREDLGWLMVYLAGGLLASFFRVSALVSIAFARFESEDYYVILPLKLILGSIATVYSTGFTILSCSQAYILEASILARTPIAILVMLFSYSVMILVGIDTSFLLYDHMYYVIADLFSYGRGTEKLRSFVDKKKKKKKEKKSEEI